MVTTYPFPYGFNPQEASDEDDYQFTAGIKGTLASWDWDLSTGFGGDKVNHFHARYRSTPATTQYAIGLPQTLTNFYDGFLQATQWTSTARFQARLRRGFRGSLERGLRRRISARDLRDRRRRAALLDDGGASSYPGLHAARCRHRNSRKNYAGYIDFATKPIEALRVDAAARFEHYSDFGNATVGKLTARYDFSPEFALRGTVNNGFRAPTLAEEYYSSTNVGPTTAYVQLPPNSPAGQLLGLGNGLQPEKSMDFSVGPGVAPAAAHEHDIGCVPDHHHQSHRGQRQRARPGQRRADRRLRRRRTRQLPPTRTASDVIDPGILGTCPPGPSATIVCGSYGINVFANGIDTRTRGADLVFKFPFEYSFGKINWSVAATYNDTTITKYAATPAALAGATSV